MSKSLFNDSIENPIHPKSFLQNFPFLSEQSSLAILHSVFPISTIVLFGGIVECSKTLLFATMIVAFIGWAVGPDELSETLVLPAFPFSLVDASVGKFSDSSALRCEAMAVYFS